MTPTRAELLPYVAHCLDDALSPLPLADILPSARLVAYQCGFEPMVIAVQSYLPGCTLTDDEAENIARDFLEERAWFAGDDHGASYIL